MLRRYGNRERFLKTFDPRLQINAGHNPEQAILSEKAPMLVVLKKAYGDNFPVMWLMQQILELVVYSNSKGTLSDYQAEFLANAIATEYYYLKVSELLLFFYKFKCGQYGHFYGVVDPMRITIALGEFVKERNNFLEREERARERAKEEAGYTDTVSPEEWCRQVGLPECHSVIEVYRMRDRIIDTIEALVWSLGIINKYLTQSQQ